MKQKLYKAGLWLCLLGLAAEIAVVIIQATARLFTNGLAFNLPLMLIVLGIIVLTINN